MVFIIFFLGLVLLGLSIRVYNEYERGVVFRLGRFAGIRGPGLFLIIPVIETVTKVDMRIITMDVPAQDVITKDNVPVKVDAVVYMKVFEPANAIIKIENYTKGTSQLAQTALRGIVGEETLDEVLSEREKINGKLHQLLDSATDQWGIRVDMVEVKHVIIPDAMQRAIARQAEAERTRRAKVTLAQGEFEASQKLKEAGHVLGAEPIHLRYLETLAEASKETNTTIIFPMEMMDILKKGNARQRGE